MAGTDVATMLPGGPDAVPMAGADGATMLPGGPDAVPMAGTDVATMLPGGRSASQSPAGPGEARSEPGPPDRSKSGPLAVGQDFGSRYHIFKALGVGGMGAVYQAWDAELGVAVALKVIRPEALKDPQEALEIERRFKRELLLARQVTNKNVVRIHDLGEIDGIKYITMPFVNGQDLDSILKQQGRLHA